MKCLYCEKEINDEATFCQYCGGNQISVDGYDIQGMSIVFIEPPF